MKTEWKWLAACCGLFAGKALAFALPDMAPLWPIAAIIGWFAVLAAVVAGWRIWYVIAVFFVGTVLAMRSIVAHDEFYREISIESRVSPIEYVFRVESTPAAKTDSKGVAWYSFQSRLESSKIRVVAPFDEGSTVPQLGEKWRMAGYLSFGGEAHGRRTFWVKGAKSSAKRIDSPASDEFWRLVRRARSEIHSRIATGIEYDPQAVSLLRCVFLGDRENASKDDMNAFSSAGTIHVFAVSGIHVVLIAGFLRTLASVCLVPWRFSGLAVLPILWFYAAMIGFSPSAVRAMVMVTVTYVGTAMLRRSCGIVAWALTFLAVNILNPAAIYNIGGMLSFAVMLALMLWSDHMPEACVRGKYGFAGFTFIAWASGVPIIVHAFERVSVVALAANLAIVPLLSIALTTSAAGILAGFVSVFAASRLNRMAALAIDMMARLSATAAAIPGATVELAGWGIIECLLWYIALFLACWLLRKAFERRQIAFWQK